MSSSVYPSALGGTDWQHKLERHFDAARHGCGRIVGHCDCPREKEHWGTVGQVSRVPFERLSGGSPNAQATCILTTLDAPLTFMLSLSCGMLTLFRFFQGHLFFPVGCFLPLNNLRSFLSCMNLYKQLLFVVF